MYDLDGDGILEIVVPSFWGEEFWYIKSIDGTFNDPRKLNRHSIDKLAGKLFDLKIRDFNNDGVDDIIVTNHQSPDDSPSGSVFIYEFRLVDGLLTWTKHVIADKLVPVDGWLTNKGVGAPGTPIPFYPLVDGSGKPAILLSGDDTRKSYILVPKSTATDDWRYDLNDLHDCYGTVGTSSVFDYDGDGKNDLFVPCYSGGKIQVYSF